jgi:uncharacterized protein YjlB
MGWWNTSGFWESVDSGAQIGNGWVLSKSPGGGDCCPFLIWKSNVTGKVDIGITLSSSSNYGVTVFKNDTVIGGQDPSNPNYNRSFKFTRQSYSVSAGDVIAIRIIPWGSNTTVNTAFTVTNSYPAGYQWDFAQSFSSTTQNVPDSEGNIAWMYRAGAFNETPLSVSSMGWWNTGGFWESADSGARIGHDWMLAKSPGGGDWCPFLIWKSHVTGKVSIDISLSSSSNYGVTIFKNDTAIGGQDPNSSDYNGNYNFSLSDCSVAVGDVIAIRIIPWGGNYPVVNTDFVVTNSYTAGYQWDYEEDFSSTTQNVPDSEGNIAWMYRAGAYSETPSSASLMGWWNTSGFWESVDSGAEIGNGWMMSKSPGGGDWCPFLIWKSNITGKVDLSISLSSSSDYGVTIFKNDTEIGGQDPNTSDYNKCYSFSQQSYSVAVGDVIAIKIIPWGSYPVVNTSFTVTVSSASLDSWIEHSATKVFQTDTKPLSPRASADLHCAKGEWESFQIVLRSNEGSLNNIQVGISDLTSGTNTISASAINACFVDYVTVQNTYVAWPDILPPMGLTNYRLNLIEGQTQPIWITVKVPRNCTAGNYRGLVTIKADGGDQVLHVVPINLHVWNFPLPVTSRCSTAFGLPASMIAAKHGVTDPAEIYNMQKIYYDFLLDHKISAQEIPPYTLASPDWDSAESVSYLSDPRMTGFIIPYLSGNDVELTTLVTYLKNNGYHSKGYFYVVDEPTYKDAYQQIWAAGDRLAQIDPEFRMVSPFFCNPSWSVDPVYDHCVGDLGLWSPRIDFLDHINNDGTTIRDHHVVRQNAGDEGWMYVCWDPSNPYPNLLLDIPGMNHRIIPWMVKKEKNKGLLYWSTAWWDYVSDPWFSMMTMGSGYPNTFGDGSLLYPGRRAGVDLVNGPVSSIRLEVLRDAIEDYDYLCMVESCYSAARMNEYLSLMITSVTSFQTDPWAMEVIRVAMGNDIEASYNSTAFPDGFQVVYKNKILFSEGFESGNFTAGGWTNSGCTITNSDVYAGIYSTILNSSDSLTKAISTAGYDNIQLVYTRKTLNMNYLDHFYAEWYNGSAWSTVENLTGTANTYKQKVFILPSGANDNANFKIRFRTSHNNSTDYVFLDHVKVIGRSTTQQSQQMPGDANGDGMVDVGDLGILAANYGTVIGASWSMGDFNADGAVDVGDLGILAAHYGEGVINSNLDFETDYTKAFGMTLDEEISNNEDSVSSLACGAVGLPLIVCLLLVGLMPVRWDE